MERPRRVLVLGATGYVGGRLVPELLDAGFDVRCLTTFVPRGIFGRLYWWILVPFHAVIFPAMLRRMMRAAGDVV